MANDLDIERIISNSGGQFLEVCANKKMIDAKMGRVSFMNLEKYDEEKITSKIGRRSANVKPVSAGPVF